MGKLLSQDREDDMERHWGKDESFYTDFISK